MVKTGIPKTKRNPKGSGRCTVNQRNNAVTLGKRPAKTSFFMKSTVLPKKQKVIDVEEPEVEVESVAPVITITLDGTTCSKDSSLDELLLMKQHLLRALNGVESLLKTAQQKAGACRKEEGIVDVLGVNVVKDAKKAAKGHRYSDKQKRFINAAIQHFKNPKVVHSKCALVGIHVPIQTIYTMKRKLLDALPKKSMKSGRKPLPVEFEMAVLNDLIVTSLEETPSADGNRSVSIRANCVHSYDTIRQALKEQQALQKWQNDSRIQRCKFSEGYVRLWLVRMRISRKR